MHFARRARLPATVAALSLLAGCATYHPRPLPDAPDLAGRVPALHVPTAGLGLPGLKPAPFNARDGLGATETVILAVLNNPDLKAERLKRGIGRAQLMDARLLPDPQLSVGMDHPTGGGPGVVNAYNLGINQDLRALISRGAATDSARAQAHQVDLNILWQEWQVAEKARQLFAQAREQEQLHKVYASAHDLYRQHYQNDKAALQRGDITLSVAAGDLASLVDAGSRLRQLETQRNQTSHDLTALLGLKPTVAMHLTGDAELPPLSEKELSHALSTLPQRRPDLMALRAGYRSQEASVRKAILEQFPSINVGFSRARDTGGVQTVGLGVSISLPLFNGNRGGIAIARATRAHLRQAYQARLDQAAGQADQAFRQTALLARQLRQVEDRVPELEHVTDQAGQALKAGDIDAGTYITLRAQLLHTRAEAIQLRSSLQQARVALQTVLALPFQGASTQ